MPDRRGRVAVRGSIQNAGTVPVSFGPDNDIRVAIQGDGVWRRFDLEKHLGVRKVREDDFSADGKRLRAEVRPEIDKTVLRLTVDFSKSLSLDVVHARLDEPECHRRLSILVTDGQPLNLGEVAEESDAQTSGRLVSDEADEVSRDKIVAVEFLIDWAVLLGEVDGAPNCRHQHEIVRVACEAHRYRVVSKHGCTPQREKSMRVNAGRFASRRVRRSRDCPGRQQLA